MAKKKSSSNAPNTQEKPRELSPDNKLDNLKTLNQLLLKQTMEKRLEIDQLRAQIEKEAKKERSLEEIEIRVRDLERENAEIREELGQAVFERDEMERMGKKKEVAFDSLKELMEEVENEREEMRDEIGANVVKIRAVKDEGFKALEDKRKLEMEIRALKDEFGLLKREEEGLRLMVIELEKGNGDAQEEIGTLRASICLLEREKEEKETEFKSKITSFKDECHRVLEIKHKLEGEIRDLKDGFASLKREEEGMRLKVIESEEKNGDTQKEIGGLRASIGVLEKLKELKEREFESKIRDLELSFDARNEKAQEEIGSLTTIISVLENNNKEKEWEFESKIRELSLSFDERNGEAQEEFGRLRASIIAVESEKEEREKESESKIRELALNCEEMSLKLRQIFREKDEVEKVRTEQEVEILELRKKEDGLRLKVVELEEKSGEGQEEIGRLRERFAVLENEKVAKERVFESKTRELALKLDVSSKKMGEVLNEKDEVEKVGAEQELKILELKKEVEKLHLNVEQLEDMCRDYGEKNAELLDEKDSVKRQFAVLEKELMQKEKEFDAKVGELVIKLDDLCTKMKEISMEKDDIETEKTKLDVEILELKKEVAKLGSNVSELEERCKDYGHRYTQLQDERDALKLQVDDFKMSKDEWLVELMQLNALIDVHVSEKEAAKRHIESLENSLFAAKEESELMIKKFSDKILTLLKSTAASINGSDRDHENGFIDDDKIRPFAEELEGVKGAFKSKVSEIEEMNRELKVLQKAMNDARNKKQGLFMWLYPAATTVLAAISFAYAARKMMGSRESTQRIFALKKEADDLQSSGSFKHSER